MKQEWHPTDERFARDVTIKMTCPSINAPALYAVFDGDERVSDKFGPLNDTDCIWFARGYAKAKEKHALR